MSQQDPDDAELVAPIDPTDSIQAQLDRARARHGTLGAMVFSAMLGVDKVLGRKPKDKAQSSGRRQVNPKILMPMASPSTLTIRPKWCLDLALAMPRAGSVKNEP